MLGAAQFDRDRGPERRGTGLSEGKPLTIPVISDFAACDAEDDRREFSAVKDFLSGTMPGVAGETIALTTKKSIDDTRQALRDTADSPPAESAVLGALLYPL